MADGSDCCGTSICDTGLCLEDFLCAVRKLYPDFQGRLCPGGVFDGLVAALVKPLYDSYLQQCGICDLEVETNPLTACCTIDRWMDEYAIGDLCQRPDLCVDPALEVITLTKRAQLRARIAIEYSGHPDAAFYEMLAAMFGLEIEVRAPVLLDGKTAACETYTAWSGSIPKFKCDPCEGLPLIAYPSKCNRMPHSFIIKINCAPPQIINYANCGRVGQPIAFNPYVDAFKCLVREYKPHHVALCFIDAWTTDPCKQHPNPCLPPDDVDPCPRPARGCPEDVRCW